MKLASALKINILFNMKKILVLVLCFAAFFANAENVEKNFNVNSFENIEVISFKLDNLVQQDTIKNESTTVKKVADQAKKNNVKPETSVIIPSQGFSLTNLMRGLLGMFSLIVIAFLFSSNKKAIDWKTVGIGLGAQLLIAVGVLKVPFIQRIFEWIGGLFVSVLDFTRAGSKFLFEGLVVDMDLSLIHISEPTRPY